MEQLHKPCVCWGVVTKHALRVRGGTRAAICSCWPPMRERALDPLCRWLAMHRYLLALCGQSLTGSASWRARNTVPEMTTAADAAAPIHHRATKLNLTRRRGRQMKLVVHHFLACTAGRPDEGEDGCEGKGNNACVACVFQEMVAFLHRNCCLAPTRFAAAAVADSQLQYAALVHGWHRIAGRGKHAPNQTMGPPPLHRKPAPCRQRIRRWR